MTIDQIMELIEQHAKHGPWNSACSLEAIYDKIEEYALERETMAIAEVMLGSDYLGEDQ